MFTEKISLVDSYILNWKFKSAETLFWSKIATDKQLLDLFINQISYFYKSSLNFWSSILHKDIGSENSFQISQYFIKISKFLLNEQSSSFNTDVVPLCATEAICNQLFILSETDPTVFLAVAFVPIDQIFKNKKMLDILSIANFPEIAEISWKKYFNVTNETKNYLNKLQNLTLRKNIDSKILNQTHLLLETADLLFEELLETSTNND